ncbi:hypothetical protein [Methylobacterium sp.]|uniref:hypothetical protein n=1 Tax=Methylobacterium sp. TaxID=409 RepID=UPI003B0073F5
MANKHFVHAARHPTATIQLGSFDVPCSVLASNDGSAHVRVLTTGGIPEHLTFLRDGQAQRARYAFRKQSPLGLDLWLDLQVAEDIRAAYTRDLCQTELKIDLTGRQAHVRGIDIHAYRPKTNSANYTNTYRSRHRNRQIKEASAIIFDLAGEPYTILDSNAVG